MVVVSCASLNGRHAVAAFEVKGEMFKTVLGASFVISPFILPSVTFRSLFSSARFRSFHTEKLTFAAENSLGDAFYVTEHNYARHLLLDVTIAQTFDQDGAASDISPPELPSYRETLTRNKRRLEEDMKGLGAGEAVRQKDLAVKEQREARTAAARARRAL